MKNIIIMVLVFLLALSAILGSVLGTRNACPDPKTGAAHVMLVNIDTPRYMWVDVYPFEEQGRNGLSLQVVLNDADLIGLLSPEWQIIFASTVPVPTACPTCTATATPVPTTIPTITLTTPTPTPTPQFTGIRKYIEDRRYVPVASVECVYSYLVRINEINLCSADISYGYNTISASGQIFYDSGLVYVKTSVDKFELVYMSGLDKYFLTHEEYVVFCVQARVNAGGSI